MAKDFKVDIKGLKEFIQKLKEAASGDLQKQYKLWLEAAGMEFLGIVQDEIIRLKVVDTRRLLNSFGRGDGDCIFELTDKGLKLEIGTNLVYAAFVNDGHWTTASGVAARWVPGKWTVKGFEYDKTSKEGMLLKRKWVEGYHYFDISVKAFEKILAVSMEKKLQEWLDTF